jgi:tetratricopeptide (TPR) repeat protein
MEHMQYWKSVDLRWSASAIWVRASLFILFTILLAQSHAYVCAQIPIAQPSGASVSTPAPASESPLNMAEQLYRTGRLDDAAAGYSKILEADPKSAAAYAGLVRVYLKQKKLAEAYNAADKAIQLAPTLEAARVARAEADFRQGKVVEAEKEFSDLIRAGARDPRAHLGLSRVYRAASFHEHAKLAIDRAYQLDPNDPDIVRERIDYLGPKERLKALQLYLSGTTNDGPEELRDLGQLLVILQDRATQPAHTCRLATKVSAMQTNLEGLYYDAKNIREYALRVNVNGTSSRLMLDTGASGILINRKIAEKAGIKRVVQTDVGGIGDKGPASGYVGYADSIAIGELEFRDCYVEVIDQNSVIGDDGLIGADVFSNFLVDIDFPNSKFKVSPLPARPDEPIADTALESGSVSQAPRFHDRYIAPEMRTFSPVLQFGHNLPIPTKVNDSTSKLFLIDTGAFGNAISPEAAREVTKVSADKDARIKGLSGNVKEVFRADEVSVTFGHLKQRLQDLTSFDTSSTSNSIGTEVSGFLGFRMLRLLEIKIDYRDGLIDFEYDPKRNH